jgi:hypothetical protein
MTTFALLDETFWLNVTNAVMAAVTLGLVAYFVTVLFYGALVARNKQERQS